MLNFMSMARDAVPGPDQAESPRRSVSVELTIRGWHREDGPLDSHALCRLLRDGGLRLGAALDLTKAVLDGRDIAARLPFADRASAHAALTALGARLAEPNRSAAAAE